MTFEELGNADAFFLFSDAGTKAVASFFRSRNSGSAEIMALVCTPLAGMVPRVPEEGFGGKEGCPGGN